VNADVLCLNVAVPSDDAERRST